MSEPRAEFSKATKEFLAKRAGYQCSVLNCGRLTTGPGPGPGQVVDIGMAAHIFAAAAGGPRGTGGLSASERSSAENGIWCCYDHGKLIDSAKGDVISALDLRAWKRLHEARKGAEVCGGHPTDRFGFVDRVNVRSAPVLGSRQFELGMRNIITGPNGSGKTVLTSLIGSVARPDIMRSMARRADLSLKVKWFDPAPHEVENISVDGNIRQTYDGSRVPFVARPYKTIHIASADGSDLASMQRLCQLFDLNTTAMQALLEELPEHSQILREVTVVAERLSYTVERVGAGVRSGPPHHLFGRHEAALVLTELAALHARYHSQIEPTFLLLDELFDMAPGAPTVDLFEQIERIAPHAQVAVVSHAPWVIDRCSTWTKTELSRVDWDRSVDANRFDASIESS
ncbi:hypothetical protein KIH74_35525 [Kineosporia sp. J2-2]|uniref:Uncharacterized protein n=1 Tax=Kineosporia corallincola TaxID=2835133 RepID=A0ABS5TU74_9ACTN|nr:hypothetical protein [Kineosporia corallincola]MBT0774309.1 hypothetical protein [Kineosporia corallincola]